MDPLGTVSPMMEILRRQMSANLEKLRRAGGATSGMGELPRIAGKPVAQGLHQALARRIGALEANDPAFQEKAAAVFVESILVSEFGEKLVNDPGFRLMIREVASTMCAEPAIAADLARLFRELQAPGS